MASVGPLLASHVVNTMEACKSRDDKSVESSTLSRGPGISCDADLREGLEGMKASPHGQDMREALGEREISEYRAVTRRTIANIQQLSTTQP
jgi:hypothetical protein